MHSTKRKKITCVNATAEYPGNHSNNDHSGEGFAMWKTHAAYSKTERAYKHDHQTVYLVIQEPTEEAANHKS